MPSVHRHVLLVKLIARNIVSKCSITFIHRAMSERRQSTRNRTAYWKKIVSESCRERVKLADILALHNERWAKTLAEVVLVCHVTEFTQRCDGQGWVDSFSRGAKRSF